MQTDCSTQWTDKLTSLLSALKRVDFFFIQDMIIAFLMYPLKNIKIWL